MSLFPHFSNNDALFRLLDDYNTHAGNSPSSSSIRAFTPKFDVREHESTYELQGELPGIEQKDIHIEFADPHTLVIKGHTEREYSSDGAQQARGRITGDVTDSSRSESRKATVEDEAAEEDKSKKQVTKEGEGQRSSKSKYWVSERLVGEFHRAFSFPTTVDQDGVKANLKNGILSIIIPKTKRHAGKRITIE